MMMRRLQDIVAAVRSRCFGSSLVRQADKMDPTVRAVLAESVADEMKREDPVRAAEQIELELREAKRQLASSQENERFLGVRSRKYRKALDERAEELREEKRRLGEERRQDDSENSRDENGKDEERFCATEERERDLERRMQKLEKDEDALSSIVETHKNILANCERIRRKIDELEKKKEEILSVAKDCEDFLTAVSAAESNKSLKNTSVANSTSLEINGLLLATGSSSTAAEGDDEEADELSDIARACNG